ncbi:hypothetical protein Leryth_011050 [Lithospermum erythrorhizon]|nr:hypothetical protein Leryth_011050 [Lithospermum erythrorhizon]
MPINSFNYDDRRPTNKERFFGREKPLHALLGGGKVGDILLWRNKHLSAAILVGFSIVWFLFEVAEYNVFTLMSQIFIGLMVILFIWSSGATLIDWTPPDLRSMMVRDSSFHGLSRRINLLLFRFYDISTGKDMKTFLLAITFLWILSVFGNYFSSLNMFYIGFLCLMTLPAFYERYKNEVDHLAFKGKRDTKNLLKKLDLKVLDKIPRGPTKEKKKY